MCNGWELQSADESWHPAHAVEVEGSTVVVEAEGDGLGGAAPVRSAPGHDPGSRERRQLRCFSPLCSVFLRLAFSAALSSTLLWFFLHRWRSAWGGATGR